MRGKVGCDKNMIRMTVVLLSWVNTCDVLSWIEMKKGWDDGSGL